MTMDKFDRATQREILQILYDAYPEKLTQDEADVLLARFPDYLTSTANLLYLESHELIKSGLHDTGGGYIAIDVPEITHKGIDFIRDDGGLSAILNVQTVKLHDSTIIALEDIIRVANLPEEKKSVLISKLRELPADTIKHLTLQLLTPAVLHPQTVIQSIEKFLQAL